MRVIESSLPVPYSTLWYSMIPLETRDLVVCIWNGAPSVNVIRYFMLYYSITLSHAGSAVRISAMISAVRLPERDIACDKQVNLIH